MRSQRFVFVPVAVGPTQKSASPLPQYCLVHNGLQGRTLDEFARHNGMLSLADGSIRLESTKPRTRTLNGTAQAGPDLRRAIESYVRAYASLHGRQRAAETFGVSYHTLWRFLERGRAVPSAVLNSVGGSVEALEAATLEIIIDLEGLRRDLALRPLREGLEKILLLLCAAPALDDLLGWLTLIIELPMPRRVVVGRVEYGVFVEVILHE